MGAGVAGLAAVQRLRADGYDGRLVLLGAESHRPYSRPPLSKAVLAGRAEAMEATAVRGADLVDDLAEFRPAVTAVALDPRARTVAVDDGEVLVYDRMLVATGARARRLTVPGAQLAGVHVLRTIDDCAAIRADLAQGAPVVVVGGGFVGCEVAATLATGCASLTIVEPQPTVLLRALGREVGDLMAQRHRVHGVRVETGVAVTAFLGADRVEAVELGDGRRLPAAVVVVGVGAVPDTTWLKGSGVALGDGVLCDQFCESGSWGVFAAGDVARFQHPLRHEPVRIEHWTNAGEHGSAAATNMLRNRAEMIPYAPVPYVWSDQFGAKLQVFGFTDGADEQVVLPDPADPAKWQALFGRGGTLTAVAILGIPTHAPRARNAVASRLSLDAARAVLSYPR